MAFGLRFVGAGEDASVLIALPAGRHVSVRARVQPADHLIRHEVPVSHREHGQVGAAGG
jgi:hypothetical protein